jgi:hypothetical protein
MTAYSYDLGKMVHDLEAAFFPMKHTDDTAADRWVSLVKRKLGHFDAKTLQDAVEDLISHRKTRSFPSLAELITACEQHAPRDKQRQATQAVGFNSEHDVNHHLEGERVFEMLMYANFEKPHPMLLKAARAEEPWIAGLQSFVIKHHRLPKNGEEEAECIANSYKFLQDYETAVRGGFRYAKALEGLGDSMMAKREELRQRVLDANNGGTQ